MFHLALKTVCELCECPCEQQLRYHLLYCVVASLARRSLKGGARRKTLNQFDNQQTKRTAQRKLAELDFTAAIRGYQYDCGDYILRVGGVFIKGNNSHSLILEVEYLPPMSTTSRHYAKAAEAVARELATAAFGVRAASTRSKAEDSQGHQGRIDSKDALVGGGAAAASVDTTHFIDVELRGSWVPPTDSSGPQVCIATVVELRHIVCSIAAASHSTNLLELTFTGATTRNGSGWVRGGG